MSSTELARPYLGQRLTVTIDRPLGSAHPQYGFEYPVNYGYVLGVLAPDGDELDVYVLGVDEPLTEFTGRCIAIVHRQDDDDDKLVLVPDGIDLSEAQILSQIHFQEQYYDTRLLRP
jgi:inorganic pyrophosphatase